MELTEDIKNAALILGKSLREDVLIRSHLDAVDELQADSEARALEEQFITVMNSITAREHAGEQISREDKRELYELRHQLHMCPAITNRDFTLQTIKPSLAEYANEISAMLGVDYRVLAMPENSSESSSC